MKTGSEYISYCGFGDSGRDVKYSHKLENDLQEIKQILDNNPNEPITYGKGWIRIAGKNFNGITKNILKKYCNIAI